MWVLYCDCVWVFFYWKYADWKGFLWIYCKTLSLFSYLNKQKMLMCVTAWYEKVISIIIICRFKCSFNWASEIKDHVDDSCVSICCWSFFYNINIWTKVNSQQLFEKISFYFALKWNNLNFTVFILYKLHKIQNFLYFPRENKKYKNSN